MDGNEPLTLASVLKGYGEVPLYFQSYYKYAFTFEGTTADGLRIVAVIGGDSHSIYKWSVRHDEPWKLVDCVRESPYNDDLLWVYRGDDLVFEYPSRLRKRLEGG